jgi:hypothetical protein
MLTLIYLVGFSVTLIIVTALMIHAFRDTNPQLSLLVLITLGLSIGWPFLLLAVLYVIYREITKSVHRTKNS